MEISNPNRRNKRPMGNLPPKSQEKGPTEISHQILLPRPPPRSINEWDHEPGRFQMYKSIASTNLSCGWRANSWGISGGRYELNIGGVPAISCTSRIRISRCHETFSLLDVMLPQRLMPNVIIYNAAISVCGKGQKPQQACICCRSCSSEASCPT